MKSIVTLTLNPAIDGASETEKVQPTLKIRTTNARTDPGGGGINVARVVRELGGNSLALYLAGGATGRVLEALIERCGLDAKRLDIKEDTRISHVVFERSSGLEYRFVPEGPKLEPFEWQRCLEQLKDLPCDYLVASGSLPRGVPADFYARVAAIARRQGAKFVLDSSGEPLRVALEAGGIHLVKPNLRELEAITGHELREPAAIEDAAMAHLRAGKVDMIAVTMGGKGALLASPKGFLLVDALDVTPRSTVGAGDSFTAAMTYGLATGLEPEKAFKLGIAAGTAAILTPGTVLCRRDDVMRFYAELLVTAPPPSGPVGMLV